MNIPENLRYSPTHEWAELDADNKVRVGITEYAQDALGDIVFVNTPAVGTEVKAGEAIGEVESTKSVSDIYAPVGGVVVEVNNDLADSPQTINEDPYGKGWICVIQTSVNESTAGMLDDSAYRNLVAEH